jgi:hypothetical protein
MFSCYLPGNAAGKNREDGRGEKGTYSAALRFAPFRASTGLR